MQGQKNPADSSSMPPGAQREGHQAARWDGCQPAAGSRRLRGSHAAGSTSLCMFLFCFTLQQGQQLLCSSFEREDELCSLAACGTGAAVSRQLWPSLSTPSSARFPFHSLSAQTLPFPAEFGGSQKHLLHLVLEPKRRRKQTALNSTP